MPPEYYVANALILQLAKPQNAAVAGAPVLLISACLLYSCQLHSREDS
jgi:hypothetical protein